MYGEKPILGKKLMNVDSKSRIILPTFTYIENGEEIIVTYDDDIDVYRLYTYKQLKEIIEQINNNFKNIKTIEEEIEYKKRHLCFYKSIIITSIADKQHRILLGEEFEPNSKVECIGCNDHVVLQKKKNSTK